MKVVLIIIGLLVFLVLSLFCWLIIAGADESRKRKQSDSDSRE